MAYHRHVTPPDGPWEPDAVAVDLRRATIVAVVLNLVIWPGFLAVLVFGVIVPDPDWRVRAIAGVFAALCLIPLIALARRWRFLLVPMGFAFDRRGLHYWRGAERGLLPWDEIAAFGIGFESPPDVPSLSPADLVAKVTVDRVVKNRRRLALEIFPRSPEAWDRAPALALFQRHLDPPWSDVSGQRWQIPLGPGVARRITRGAQHFAPEPWRGWFRRPWNSGLVRLRRPDAARP